MQATDAGKLAGALSTVMAHGLHLTALELMQEVQEVCPAVCGEPPFHTVASTATTTLLQVVKEECPPNTEYWRAARAGWTAAATCVALRYVGDDVGVD